MAYVKIHSKILRSSLWMDKPARDVFLTALFMAEPHVIDEPAPQIAIGSLEETGFAAPAGRYGLVNAAGPGIVYAAGVPYDEGMAALKRLGEPDEESRTKDYEGRRMIRIDGGFLILNYAVHRDKDTTAPERYARWKAKQVKERGLQPLANGRQRSPTALQTHVDVDVDVDVETTTATTLSGKPDVGPCQTCVSGLRELNSIAGTNYRLTSKAALKAAHARHTEHGDESLLVVVRHKCRDWVRDPKMAKFLRPATLFRASNFAAYLDDAIGGNTKPAGAGTFDYSDEGTIWPVTVVKVGK